MDQMSKFGYKTSKTGFSLGTSFEQYENILNQQIRFLRFQV